MRKLMKWGLGLLALIIVISVAAGGGGKKKDDSSSSSSGKSSSASNNSTPAACGTKATDTCTPHVGPNGRVRVDALTWTLSSASTAQTIGDPQIGGATANGVYVVLKLHVHSDKNDSATVSSDVVKLQTNGNTYDSDNDGTTAAELSGTKSFFLNTIGPDSDLSGTVVFDVPRKILGQKVEIRFNELGFGSTHGYIRIPHLS